MAFKTFCDVCGQEITTGSQSQEVQVSITTSDSEGHCTTDKSDIQCICESCHDKKLKIAALLLKLWNEIDGQ